MSLLTASIMRPVATSLLCLACVLGGVLAFRFLPVAPLPQLDFPMISVSAQMAGASPETMASSVATPLEQALGSIAGVTQMSSRSSEGSTRIMLMFDLDRDIDSAARDVQAAINAARSMLPSGLRNNPTYHKVNPSSAPIMVLALTSDTLSQGALYDLASTVLAQKLSQVSGVGEVSIGGSSLPAIRVTLNPLALSAAGVSLDQVRTALSAANTMRPNGVVANDRHHWQLNSGGQLTQAEQYRPLVVGWRDGAPIRLQDVGKVQDSVEDLYNTGFFNDRQAVLLIVRRQSDANIIATVDAIRDRLPDFAAMLPASATLTVAQDRTPSIRASLQEAELTLIIAVLLVVLVVLAFLGRLRAALIPSLAVPASLITTFSIMLWLGYTLNTISLMALIVATGFVVDDAIVVLENIMRHVERGLSPMRAALQGVREVGFTVLAMSLSLVAVFIPILLMGGIPGRLFREFAVTLSAAILISLVISLTLTPMMCAYLLPRRPSRKQGERWGGRMIARAGAFFLRGYDRSLRWALDHGALTLLMLGLTIVLNFTLYSVVPKGFFPQQDTGQLMGFFRVDQGTSFPVMQEKLERFRKRLLQDPDVDTVTGFAGARGGSNSSFLLIQLKPFKERTANADQVVNRMRGEFQKEPGAQLFLVPQQDIRVGGRQSSSGSYDYTLMAGDLDLLRTWMPRVQKALAALPELVDVSGDVEDKGQRVDLVIDRDEAARLGVSMSTIASTLNSSFSQRQVSVIYRPLNQYHVVMGVDPLYARDVGSLEHAYVINAAGERVPLAAFTRFEMGNAPLSVSHEGLFAADGISFGLAPGVSLDQATRAIEAAVAEIGLPSQEIQAGFQGTAQLLQSALAQQPWLILAALVTMYIVLGILYESTIHPITILSTLPSAGVGALLALLLFGEEFTLIALLGVFLLIGIVKKNAIMMVDFALHAERDLGLSSREAIHQACLVRFRPIMMTTVSAMFGALPLILARGAGVELRQPLGLTIVGGLLVSQILTLYTTPVVYLYLDRLRHRSPRLRSVGAMLALLVLSACAVGPDYQRPALDVGVDYKEVEGWKRAEPSDEVLRADWWSLYGDPVLAGLLEGVAAANQNVRQAEARYRQAIALLGGAQAARYPVVRGDVSATRSGFGGGEQGGRSGSGSTLDSGGSGGINNPSNQYTLSAGVSWELDLWGRVRRSVEAGRAEVEASAADIAATVLSMQTALAQSYFQLRGLDAEQKLLEQTVAAYERSLEMTENRYQAGVAAQADVAVARTQVENARVSLIALRWQRAQAEHAIAVLLGKPPSGFQLDPTGVVGSVPAIPVGLPSHLLERRPDIAAAERRTAEANARIGVATAAWFPDLTLSAQAGFRSGQWAQWLSAPSTFWSLGPALALTIFDAGARRSQVDQARAVHEAQAAAYRQTVLSALQEVEDRLVQLHVMGEQQEAQALALAAARESLRLTQNQYNAGLIDYLSVVQVQATALNAERSALSLQTDRLVSSVNLIAALGGGWDGEPSDGKAGQP